MPVSIHNTYPATSVTVTNTAQSLLSLLLAKDATIPPRGREITIQNDPSSANNIRIGGSAASGTGLVGATNCAYVLTPGASRTYRCDSHDNSSPLPLMWVVTDSGTSQLNVEIVRK